MHFGFLHSGESMSNTTQTVLPSQEDVLTEHGKVQVENPVRCGVFMRCLLS